MKRLLAGLAAAFSLFFAVAPAGAVVLDPTPPAPDVITTYSFIGICEDCPPVPGGGGFPFPAAQVGISPGSGLLTLKNYTAGDPLALANFVSFRYESTNFPSGSPFEITSPVEISGSLGDDFGPYDVYFADFANYFQSFTDTTWSLGPLVRDADRGTLGLWAANGSAAVPETATWAMMIGGLGVAGAAIRRRRPARAAALA